MQVLAVAALLCHCGMVAASGAGGAVAGTWVAVDEHQAGALTLVLRAAGEAGAIAGRLRQQRGALPQDELDVTGRWQAPQLTLAWRAADGTGWSLSARMVGPEQLQATLSGPGGLARTLNFVRP